MFPAQLIQALVLLLCSRKQQLGAFLFITINIVY